MTCRTMAGTKSGLIAWVYAWWRIMNSPIWSVVKHRFQNETAKASWPTWWHLSSTINRSIMTVLPRLDKYLIIKNLIILSTSSLTEKLFNLALLRPALRRGHNQNVSQRRIQHAFWHMLNWDGTLEPGYDRVHVLQVRQLLCARNSCNAVDWPDTCIA